MDRLRSFMNQAKPEIREEYELAYDIFDKLFNRCKNEFDEKVCHFAYMVMRTHGAILNEMEERF